MHNTEKIKSRHRRINKVVVICKCSYLDKLKPFLVSNLKMGVSSSVHVIDYESPGR